MIKENKPKKIEVKESVVVDRPLKIQTAEGWKRAMLKKRKAEKKK
jgi:hypothetical protein